MARKRYSDEDCLKVLRAIELQLAAGSDIPTACRSAGISDDDGARLALTRLAKQYGLALASIHAPAARSARSLRHFYQTERRHAPKQW